MAQKYFQILGTNEWLFRCEEAGHVCSSNETEAEKKRKDNLRHTDVTKVIPKLPKNKSNRKYIGFVQEPVHVPYTDLKTF